VVGASHLVGQWGNAVTEVLTNRALSAPFQFVQTKAVQGGTEAAFQYSFEVREGLARALSGSLFRNFAAPGGVVASIRAGVTGAIGLPIRASWNMGPGLMASAITDRILSQKILNLDPDSKIRKGIQFGSFFIPDLYRIGVGNTGPAFFRSQPVQFTTRAFAAGFLSDMVFMGWARMEYGTCFKTENLIYHRANELSNQDRSGFSKLIDGAFELVAPTVAAWWDSVELKGLQWRPNKYAKQARRELNRFSKQLNEQSHSIFQQVLLFGTAEESLNPKFYQRIDWKKFRNNQTTPTHPINRDGKTGFKGINLVAVRKQIGNLHHMPSGNNLELRLLFDESGKLYYGKEPALLQHVFDNPNMDEKILLGNRQLALAIRILKLRDCDDEKSKKQLKKYHQVAKQIGMINGRGEFLSTEILKKAQKIIGSTKFRFQTISSNKSYTMLFQ
jgi:hypothetical protein